MSETIPQLNEYLVIVSHRHDEHNTVEIEGIHAVDPTQARMDAMNRAEWPYWAEPREGRRNPPPGTRVVVWDVTPTDSAHGQSCKIHHV